MFVAVPRIDPVFAPDQELNPELVQEPPEPFALHRVHSNDVEDHGRFFTVGYNRVRISIHVDAGRLVRCRHREVQPRIFRDGRTLDVFDRFVCLVPEAYCVPVGKGLHAPEVVVPNDIPEGRTVRRRYQQPPGYGEGRGSR